MSQECRLYVNGDSYIFSSVDEAEKVAEKHMPSKAELRIEYLFETEEHDFWAWEYENCLWAPS